VGGRLGCREVGGKKVQYEYSYATGR
jgi:hypothetical protein